VANCNDGTDWREALAEWRRLEVERAEKEARPAAEGWWEQAFAMTPTPSEIEGHPCGHREMLAIVAYDIADRRRLSKIAKVCEDFGVRVQYSVFECRLEAEQFDRFWGRLLDEIDPDEDRLVAYKVCAACARGIRSAGTQMHYEKVVAYVF